jgi:hypothetical protein
VDSTRRLPRLFIVPSNKEVPFGGELPDKRVILDPREAVQEASGRRLKVCGRRVPRRSSLIRAHSGTNFATPEVIALTINVE